MAKDYLPSFVKIDRDDEYEKYLKKNCDWHFGDEAPFSKYNPDGIGDRNCLNCTRLLCHCHYNH